MTKEHKRIQAVLYDIADKNPNVLISALFRLYNEEFDEEELRQLKRFVKEARRSPGYDKEQDLLLANGIC